MADPSILALIQHLNWTPPAIVQSVEVGLHGERIRAYGVFVAAQERDLADWIAKGEVLRARMWHAMFQPDIPFSVDILSEMASIFEADLRREAKAVARFKKRARKTDRHLSPQEWSEVAGYQDRLVAVAERFYKEGQDFAAFMRAMRAEMDPESHGGPVFDDPKELERHLLSETA